MFYGEYFYHTLMAMNLEKPWKFIKNIDELEFGDALVLSVPFCDTGNQVSDINQILTYCDQHTIPVLLDCAYFTISANVSLDLQHDCIDTVVFSLSKTFPIAHARIGMRYTRHKHKDGQKLHSKINYDNRLSAAIGLHLIDQFDSDYVVTYYQTQYNRLTKLLCLQPGNSVIFADGDESWLEYSRKSLLETYGLDLDYKLFRNRICLTQLLENTNLVNTALEQLI